MPSFDPAFLDRLSLSHDVASTLRMIGEGKGKQDLLAKLAPDVLKRMRQIAIVESTESSNRLEGIVLDRGDLERLVSRKGGAKPKSRAESEIAGYQKVLSSIHEHHEGMEFTPNLVLQLHRDLFRFAPGVGGSWKRIDNQITERRPDGLLTVRFQPTPAWATPEAMTRLHRDYAAAQSCGVDPLVLLALYVLDFLCVHPFADGNGRLARLLTALLLYREGYRVAQYVSLERLIEETRESYYDTLYRASQGWHESQHDPMPWVAYFLGVVKAAYEEFGRDVSIVYGGRGAKTRLVLNAIELMWGPFTLTELHRRCPSVGADMVRRVLRDERDAGRLMVVGKGRGARWHRRSAKLRIEASDAALGSEMK